MAGWLIVGEPVGGRSCTRNTGLPSGDTPLLADMTAA
jgi:hypothetical protein